MDNRIYRNFLIMLKGIHGKQYDQDRCEGILRKPFKITEIIMLNFMLS